MDKHFIPLSNFPLPFEIKYPHRVGVKIDWPITVSFKGLVYWCYAKTAVDKKTGLPCVCYRNTEDGGDRRLWLHCDGSIVED